LGIYVKFIFGKGTLSLYSLYNTNYLNWVSINADAFYYPLFTKVMGKQNSKVILKTELECVLFYRKYIQFDMLLNRSMTITE